MDLRTSTGHQDADQPDTCVDPYVSSQLVDLLAMVVDGDAEMDMRLVIQWHANGTTPVAWSAKKYDTRWALRWEGDNSQQGTLRVSRTAPNEWVVRDTADRPKLTEYKLTKGKNPLPIVHEVTAPIWFMVRCDLADDCPLPQ